MTAPLEAQKQNVLPSDERFKLFAEQAPPNWELKDPREFLPPLL